VFFGQILAGKVFFSQVLTVFCGQISAGKVFLVRFSQAFPGYLLSLNILKTGFGFCGSRC